MAKRAERRTPQDAEARLEPEDYLGRVRLNLAELVEYYVKMGNSRPDIAVYVGLKGGHQGLRNMIMGTYKGTRIDHVVQVFVVLGVSPDAMFLPPQEFAAHLIENPPVPLAPRRRLRIANAPSSSEASETVAEPYESQVEGQSNSPLCQPRRMSEPERAIPLSPAA